MKIRFSDHQEKNVSSRRPGHGYSVDDARRVIENPIHVEEHEGRQRHYGVIAGRVVRAVTSATASAGVAMLKVVSVYRAKLPK
jgi:hypothetical protein